ncbi:MAG: cytochrome c oxidase subunit II [Gammaproteobacteria bacterium]|nr:cytochrome c oxidase subunit II [Gammaproteobacteria bacterium]MCP4091059.1 cytochrome c oxidase subunit II [Gammaproteobacteria bacterium]MCP4277415.1 cytochrome c oxidase subunit II [Gammaproteobacteria bacterium]MCP4831524.1 cytochrome c oxidase subunit II [Gammaproteobacteria bacterium]MCP4927747.1 cytochrome c oxidase subunit II [Gammaproteobacteria bacterium]
MFIKLCKPLAFTTILMVLTIILVPEAQAAWELDMPRGVSTLSEEIFGLHRLILIICTIICIGLFAFVFYTFATCRKSQGVKAAKFSHSTRAEIIWTIIPTLIVIGMAIPSARGIIKIEDTSGAEMSILVTGNQWKWSYDYLNEDKFFFSSLDKASYEASRRDSGIDPTTVDHYLRNVNNAMVVPVDTKIRLLLTSNDVIHAWWVPELYVKKDANPGFINEVWFEAIKTGIFRGQCAELCGRGHGFMPIVVVVETQERYEQWLAGDLKWDSTAQQLVPTNQNPTSTDTLAAL